MPDRNDEIQQPHCSVSTGKLTDFPDISRIIPPFIDRGLTDEGEIPENLVRQDLQKSLLTDVTKTDMLMAVEPGA